MGKSNIQPYNQMLTAQNYALQPSVATPSEQVVSLPLVSTGSLYGQIDTLRDIYLLVKNPHFVALHSRLLQSELREITCQLDNLLEQVDPLILEAIAAHPVNA